MKTFLTILLVSYVAYLTGFTVYAAVTDSASIAAKIFVFILCPIVCGIALGYELAKAKP